MFQILSKLKGLNLLYHIFMVFLETEKYE